jgi:hypothetical protein
MGFYMVFRLARLIVLAWAFVLVLVFYLVPRTIYRLCRGRNVRTGRPTRRSTRKHARTSKQVHERIATYV